jgi:hypothetical protein
MTNCYSRLLATLLFSLSLDSGRVKRQIGFAHEPLCIALRELKDSACADHSWPVTVQLVRAISRFFLVRSHSHVIHFFLLSCRFFFPNSRVRFCFSLFYPLYYFLVFCFPFCFSFFLFFAFLFSSFFILNIFSNQFIF